MAKDRENSRGWEEDLFRTEEPGTVEELKEQLSQLARAIVSGISAQDPAHSQELLGAFVSELFVSATEQTRRQDQRQKQAEGIAAAKARGVRFGRQAKPLPENFDEVYQAWRDKKLPLQQAAEACGMPKSSFYSAAVRKERSAALERV